jgi:hypothetical protein
VINCINVIDIECTITLLCDVCEGFRLSEEPEAVELSLALLIERVEEVFDIYYV